MMIGFMFSSWWLLRIGVWEVGVESGYSASQLRRDKHDLRLSYVPQFSIFVSTLHIVKQLALPKHIEWLYFYVTAAFLRKPSPLTT